MGVRVLKEQTRQHIERLASFVKSTEDANALRPDAAAFLHSLILATGAKRGVEIGTGYGYSTLWVASAISENGGRLITIDKDARKLQAARSHLEQAGLAAVVETIQDDAIDALPGVEGPIDFVLSDADKENCIAYIERIADRLSDRAVVVTDNTISHAEQLAAFVAWIRDREDFSSAYVPIGNGLELSVKRSGHLRSKGVFGA